MQRLSVPTFAFLALALAPAPLLAQKATDSRPAVMPFGALGHDGQSAIGAGLRLFPTALAPAVQPMPQPAPQPAAAGTAAPISKPGLGAAPQAIAGGPGKPAPLPPIGQPARPARSATAFAADPAVSARVRDQVLAAAMPSSPNPAGLRQAVLSGAPWVEFDRLLVQHGYDPRDLSDVVAAFYLIAWEVTTGGDATAQPAGIAAVRGQARQMLAGMPNLARMTDAERQATAETLAFHAMAMVARNQDLRGAGPGALAAYRNEVAQSVAQQQGIDLRRFALTPAGFQPR